MFHRRDWVAQGAALELVARRRLIDALMSLLNDPATEASIRERIQACRVMMVTMTEANIRLALGGEIDRRTRRRRMRETARGGGLDLRVGPDSVAATEAEEPGWPPLSILGANRCRPHGRPGAG
jgi:hypothetical protein